MKTEYEIYNRIKWDNRFNMTSFYVVVEDRVLGFKEIPLSIFDETEVPWHRVVQFKYDEEVVWDRREKIDLITDAPHRFYITKDETNGS